MYDFVVGTLRKPDGKAAFTSLTRVLIRFWAASMESKIYNPTITPNYSCGITVYKRQGAQENKALLQNSNKMLPYNYNWNELFENPMFPIQNVEMNSFSIFWATISSISMAWVFDKPVKKDLHQLHFYCAWFTMASCPSSFSGKKDWNLHNCVNNEFPCSKMVSFIHAWT